MQNTKNGKLPVVLTKYEQSKLFLSFNCRYPTSLRNRLIVLMALETGMRVSELINLQWEDIEESEYRVHVKDGKGGKDRILFIKPNLINMLHEMVVKMGREKEGYVFCTLKGGQIKDAYLRKMIKVKAKKAGIKKNVYMHLLRHTYLTTLYKKTKDIRLVQEVAGHADISTTQIYTHLSGVDVRKAMIGDEVKKENNNPDNELPGQIRIDGSIAGK